MKASWILTGTSASADNFGSSGTPGAAGTNNGVWKTTDWNWTIGRRDLTGAYSYGVSTAVQDEYAPTDLKTSLFQAQFCDAEAQLNYDVCVLDSDYGDNDFNGWNACYGTTTGAHPNQRCSRQWVRINEFLNPPAKRIACHEMGHSLGLRHTLMDGSCLKKTEDGGTSSQLTSHDVGHINSNY